VEHACLAILEQPYLLPALWRVAPSLPFVYDSQNAEADMKRMLLAGAVHAAELVDVVRTIETHAVRSAELVATCAPEDRERLEQLGPTLASWTHVPNGGDVFDIEFVTEGARARNRDALLAAMAPTNRDALERVALFVASYHPPNLEAAETIARIAPQLPHVAFLLAGSHGNHFTSWRLPPNVFVLGMVSDHLLRRLLSSTDVALNPIVSGGGTNLKLIEYFAAGAPVVSSELGVRGIDVEDGTHVLLATDAGLVQAIAETVADPGAASQRARRARALAEADYDWSIVSGHFAAAIEGALSGSDW
jgi:glycosyltransferase involved in cell wall biosynthesis